MKKILSLIAVLAIALSTLTGCGALPNTSSAGNDMPQEGNSRASDESEPQSSGIGSSSTGNAATGTEMNLSGTISTNGSTSMEKVIASLIEAFTAKHPDVTITYDATGSGAGITAVIEGTADIGLSSRNLKDSESGLDATVIALDGIAIIINNSNIVDNLTIEQIAGLFTGTFTNWSDVGGEDKPVSVIGREAGSGTRDGFETIVGVAEECAYDQELTSTGAVITAVASNEYAIGYASLSSVSGDVKSVTVEGIECSEATILNGTYAIQRPFVLVTSSGQELPAAVKAFIEYALSDETTEIIANAGAVQVR